MDVTTQLDRLVRESILRWPSLFGTRWDVLRHLYLVIGNGYEWHAGVLRAVCDDGEFSEERCRSRFFRDLDGFVAKFGPDDHDILRRARRQFVLDHLDLLVNEPRIDSGARIGAEDVALISLDYSAAFNVPGDAEESFLDGAVEVLGELVPGLYYLEQCGQDRGVRAAAGRELERLRPVDHELMQRLISEVLADEPRELS